MIDNGSARPPPAIHNGGSRPARGAQRARPRGPARALLEAVADLLRRLARRHHTLHPTQGARTPLAQRDRQVLLHVPALPAPLLQLHAQRKVLGQRVLRRPARLLERGGPNQEVGACAARPRARPSAPGSPLLSQGFSGFFTRTASTLPVPSERLGPPRPRAALPAAQRAACGAADGGARSGRRPAGHGRAWRQTAGAARVRGGRGAGQRD